MKRGQHAGEERRSHRARAVRACVCAVWLSALLAACTSTHTHHAPADAGELDAGAAPCSVTVDDAGTRVCPPGCFSHRGRVLQVDGSCISTDTAVCTDTWSGLLTAVSCHERDLGTDAVERVVLPSTPADPLGADWRRIDCAGICGP